MLRSGARWQVIHGDSEKVVRALRGGDVDHVITDPPYDEKTHSGARSSKGGGTDIGINFSPFGEEELRFAAREMVRVSKRWVLAFCALEQLGEYSRAVGPERWVRAAIWHRPDGTPSLNGDRPAQAAEGIAIMHAAGERLAWEGGGGRGHWSFGVERQERHHPTPKPLGLMLELVRLFTKPGDLVLDPFCGSGTTGVACLRLGRRFLGIEQQQQYAETARARLEAEVLGVDLSAVQSGQLTLLDGTSAWNAQNGAAFRKRHPEYRKAAKR